VALNLTKSSSKSAGKGSGDDKPGHEDDVLIREIDEAVRQDDALNFAKKYGPAIIGAVVAGLLGLGGYLWWDSSREAKLESQSELLVSAMDMVGANDFRGAADKVQPLLAEGNSPGARTAARFIQASAALKRGETGKALEMLAAIAADPQAPAALRDLAVIQEVALRFDDMKPADVIARLKPMTAPGHAYFGSAAELSAMAELEAGNRKQAGALFAAIATNEDQPETLRSRARQMAGLLGVDAIVDVTQLLKDEGLDMSGGTGAGTAGAQ
jgi:hypothetical protein